MQREEYQGYSGPSADGFQLCKRRKPLLLQSAPLDVSKPVKKDTEEVNYCPD